jgi:hypothetical protein
MPWKACRNSAWSIAARAARRPPAAWIMKSATSKRLVQRRDAQPRRDLLDSDGFEFDRPERSLKNPALVDFALS